MTIEHSTAPRFAGALREDPALYHAYAVADDGLGYALARIWQILEGRAGRVLEVGAGTGRYALALARRGAGVTAVEPAPAAVRHVRGLAAADGHRPVAPVQASVLRLPVRDRAYDAAVCFAPALYLDRAGPAQLAAEMERTVRAGGRVILAGHAFGDELERLLPAAALPEARSAEERLASELRGLGYHQEVVETAFVFATVDQAERTMGALLGPQAAAYIGGRLMYDHVSPTVTHRIRLLWKDVP